jgi:hypothetical protein
MNKKAMTKEEFRLRWDSNERGGGITGDDIADCAIAWGIDRSPRASPIELITKLVVAASGATT